MDCIEDRKSNDDILSSRVFSMSLFFKTSVCVTDAKNVSCGMEMRAGAGSANFPLLSRSNGKESRWKYEKDKSIVHSWESEETRARYNSNQPEALVVAQTGL